MNLDRRVSDLISRIYCAGRDPDAWDRIVLDMLDLCGARAGFTTAVDLKNPEFSSYRSYQPQQSSVTVAKDHVEVEYALAASRPPNASAPFREYDPAHVPDRRSETALFSRSWLPSEVERWHVGYSTSRDDLSFSFGIEFQNEQALPDDRSVELFTMMFDHVKCAARLSRRPFNQQSNRSLILLDSAGNVRQISAGARRALRPGAGLKVENRRLVTADPNEQSLLERAITVARNTVKATPTPQPVELRPTHRRRCIVVLRPSLGTYGPFGKIDCELLAEIHDGLPRIGSMNLLQSLFKLTARETEAIRLLGEGHSVESLAACMGISPNTGRTHMRAIFGKTRTCRQSELVHLCAALTSDILA